MVAMFFLPRLDCPLVVGGLEFLDKGHYNKYNTTIYLLSSSLGYASYLAYIQVEAAYTNPVLNVFIHMLMTQIKTKSSSNIPHASCNGI